MTKPNIRIPIIPKSLAQMVVTKFVSYAILPNGELEVIGKATAINSARQFVRKNNGLGTMPELAHSITAIQAEIDRRLAIHYKWVRDNT